MLWAYLELPEAGAREVSAFNQLITMHSIVIIDA